MNVNSTKVTVFGRFSYAHVFEPQASNNGGDPKYSISIIIDKDDKETIKAIETAVQNAINGGVGKFGGRIPSNLHKPLRDGDEEKPDDPAYDACLTTYLLGPDLLVSAFSPTVVIPPGVWHDWRTGRLRICFQLRSWLFRARCSWLRP